MWISDKQQIIFQYLRHITWSRLILKVINCFSEIQIYFIILCIFFFFLSACIFFVKSDNIVPKMQTLEVHPNSHSSTTILPLHLPAHLCFSFFVSFLHCFWWLANCYGKMLEKLNWVDSMLCTCGMCV